MNGGGWGGRMWVVGVYAFLYVPILCLIVFS
ncbi:MAG TPA: putrescine ABC transporter permease PotI, partial [Thauera aminoaromatica]|nr:putrescine ABC transporter permease PotI [Thauera aminoaromatica]HND57146.1 putrescine ABC transporter permease PotI [Thauera aminoaromatica]HNF75601.1 putrescine ABC transporter permease PotI [Thauera aminoaromatica]